MFSRLAIGLPVLTAAIALGGASGNWRGKIFQNWTTEDAHALMTDSPWTKKLPLPAGARPAMTVIEPGANGAPPPSGALGNPSNTTTGVNMTASGNPGSAGPAEGGSGRTLPTNSTPSGMASSVGAPEQPAAITIIWASATPIRLAMLKLRSNSTAPTETQIENATKPNEYYVVAVSGLPVMEEEPKGLAKHAYLSLKGKAPEVASESNFRKIGASDVYFFRFKREGFPISASDGQVEFKFAVGAIEVKKRFALHDMEFEGHLAL